jgi:NAD(P)H dehydrogenase (quinone)
MRVFIVHAHPEPESFNGALARRATETLRAHGHEVIVSDLYAAREMEEELCAYRLAVGF